MSDKRSIVSCIVGHIDAGKTSLSDFLRNTHVQQKEVGGITQRIGGTTFSKDSLKKMMGSLCKKDIEINGMLLLDTPGHNCYSHMRVIGMESSDLVVVVIDIMKGLEKETINCLNLLLEQHIPFIIALNKIDRINDFKDLGCVNLQKSLKAQDKFVLDQIKILSNKIICELASVGDGINGALYYENKNAKEFISMVPLSAKTGAGVPDLITLIVTMTEKTAELKKKLKNINYNFGYIIETMKDAKLGAGYMAILRDGKVGLSDKILCLTDSGPTQSEITGVFIPQEGTEVKEKINMVPLPSKDKFAYASSIIFLKTTNDNYLNGTPFFIENSESAFIEEQNKYLSKYLEKIQLKISKQKHRDGIHIATPTLGMLYACLNFAQLKITDYIIGNITKTDIIKAAHKSKEDDSDMYLYNKRYSLILNYDLPESVDKQILQFAELNNVKIISNNLIHKLFEDYDVWTKQLNQELRQRHPNIIENFKLQILQQFIFRKNDPILIGVKVTKGILKKDSIVKVIKTNGLEILLGSITNIQKNKKELTEGKANEEICIRIDSKLKYGEDFDHNDLIETYYSSEDLIAIKTFPDIFVNCN